MIFHPWPGVPRPGLQRADHILCMPGTGGGAGHGNVHHYTLISNAPQLINNNSQSGKLPQLFKAWPNILSTHLCLACEEQTLIMVSKKAKMLATLRSCMSWNVCLRLCDVGAWRPLCGLGHNRERGEMRRVRGRRRRECSINVSFSQPGSSASNNDSVTISAQLAEHCLAQNFRTFLWSFQLFFAWNIHQRFSLCLVVCQLASMTCF